MSDSHLEDEGRGVWRDGRLVVMSQYARLPSRCLKCNEPASVRLVRRLSWHEPITYVWLMVCWPVYLVMAAMTRKTATVEIPLCARHRAIRAWKIRLALAIIGVSLAISAVGASNLDEYAELLPIAAITALTGGFLAALVARPVGVERIDEAHVWLKGVGPTYLDSLARLPMRTVAESPAPRLA